jgi:hypothetical protein
MAVSPAPWITTRRPSFGAGPTPTTSTRLPLGVPVTGSGHFPAVAQSPNYRTTLWIPTLLSSSARLYEVSHGW